MVWARQLSLGAGGCLALEPEGEYGGDLTVASLPEVRMGEAAGLAGGINLFADGRVTALAIVEELTGTCRFVGFFVCWLVDYDVGIGVV